MVKQLFLSLVLSASLSVLCAQEAEKVQVISRKVEGEVRSLYNDTLYGEIKVLGAKDYYITSISFKANGKKEEVYSANDIKRFKQIVPFPDRPKFGVDEVYYESQPDPGDPYKKVFIQIKEWK